MRLSSSSSVRLRESVPPRADATHDRPGVQGRLAAARLDCRRCVCAGSSSRRPCSRSRPPRHGRAAACGRPCASRRRSRTAAPTSPRLALESDGTAVATWAEDGTVRAATRLPGKSFGAPRAIATSSTLAVPDARRRRRHARARALARPAGHPAPRSWRRRSPAPRSAAPSRRRRRRRRSPRRRRRCAPTAVRWPPTPSRSRR